MKTRRTCKRFCTLPAPDELLVPLNFPPNEDCVLEAVLFIKFLEESCVEMFAKISANLKNGDDRGREKNKNKRKNLTRLEIRIRPASLHGTGGSSSIIIQTFRSI